jgi:hypothetical protein
MLAYDFAGAKSDMHIYKPVRGLLLKNIARGAKLRVWLVNSATGEQKQLIPLSDVEKLMEYTTYGEGFYVRSYPSSSTSWNDACALTGQIKISEAGVLLDNDKYLSIDVTNNTLPSGIADQQTHLYGLEAISAPQKYLYSHERLFLPQAELEKYFGVAGSEFLVLPLYKADGTVYPLDRVQLFTTSGMSPIYTFWELLELTHEANDIVWKQWSGANPAGPAFAENTMVVLDLTGVTGMNISMTSNTDGLEIWKIDVRDSAMIDIPLPSGIRENAMVEDTVAAEPKIML